MLDRIRFDHRVKETAKIINPVLVENRIKIFLSKNK